MYWGKNSTYLHVLSYISLGLSCLTLVLSCVPSSYVLFAKSSTIPHVGFCPKVETFRDEFRSCVSRCFKSGFRYCNRVLVLVQTKPLVETFIGNWNSQVSDITEILYRCVCNRQKFQNYDHNSFAKVKSSKPRHDGREGAREKVTICWKETTVYSSLIFSQRQYFGTDRQRNVWCSEEDRDHYVRKGRPKYGLTVDCRTPDKLDSRSNSLFFRAAHTPSHVSSELCSFTVGHICQRSGDLDRNVVW